MFEWLSGVWVELACGGAIVCMIYWKLKEHRAKEAIEQKLDEMTFDSTEERESELERLENLPPFR